MPQRERKIIFYFVIHFEIHTIVYKVSEKSEKLILNSVLKTTEKYKLFIKCFYKKRNPVIICFNDFIITCIKFSVHYTMWVSKKIYNYQANTLINMNIYVVRHAMNLVTLFVQLIRNQLFTVLCISSQMVIT